MVACGEEDEPKKQRSIRGLVSAAAIVALNLPKRITEEFISFLEEGRITMQRVIITPAIAKQMLEAQNYRPTRPSIVKKYSDLMLAGRWMVSSPIIFDVGGNLRDGFHRLTAIIESGTAQKFLVILDFPEDSVKTLDNGDVRKNWHVLAAECGVSNPQLAEHKMTIIRRILLGQTGGKTGIANVWIPEVYDCLKDAVEFTLGIFPCRAHPDRAPMARPGILGATARAWMFYQAKEDKKKLAELLTRFVTSSFRTGDEALKRLREDVLTCNYGTGGSSEADMYGRAALAIQATMNDCGASVLKPTKHESGRAISRGLIKPESDLFPVDGQFVHIFNSAKASAIATIQKMDEEESTLTCEDIQEKLGLDKKSAKALLKEARKKRVGVVEGALITLDELKTVGLSSSMADYGRRSKLSYSKVVSKFGTIAKHFGKPDQTAEDIFHQYKHELVHGRIPKLYLQAGPDGQPIELKD